MKRVKSGIAAAVFVLMAGAAPSFAQAPGLAQAPAAVPGVITLTPAERTALLPVKQAVDARNFAGAASLVPAARAAARSPDARYVLARLELDIASGTQNRQAMTQAINRVLDSGRAAPDERASLLRQYAGLAYDQGNLSAADGALNRALGIVPNDPETLSMLGQLNRNRNRSTEALGFFQRAARAAEAARQPLPQSRYRLALALAEQAGQRGPSIELARQFIAAHPTPANWRDVLIVYRTAGPPLAPGQTQPVSVDQNLDALRLARAANALTGQRDYFALAQALRAAQLPAEAAAVLEEGVSRRIITATAAAPTELRTNARTNQTVRQVIAALTTEAGRQRTQLARQITEAQSPTSSTTRALADVLLSHGRYAEAAELYRASLMRGAGDAGLLNTRLGIALAMAGQRAEAEAAFRAATGNYSELAALWEIWLANRRGA